MNILPIDLLKIIRKYKDEIDHITRFQKPLDTIKSIKVDTDYFPFVNSYFLFKTFYYGINKEPIIKQCYFTKTTGTEVFAFNGKGVLYKIIYSDHGLILQNMENN